jgi:TatD DNase family protein
MPPGDLTFVDTHCHLADPAFDADRGAVVARAASVGVSHILVVADSTTSTAQARELARGHGLAATAGVHPHVASTWTREAAEMIADALDDPTVVAVGETGLDYHYDHSPRPDQRRAFEAQLALAAERHRPIVVHSRAADDDMAAMLSALGPAAPTVVLHSFSSGPRVFDAGLSIDAYFSFSGMVTFKRWPYTACVGACPAARLLLETDAPYLAPVPHRGQRNEPAFVPHIAVRIANLRDVSPTVIAAESTENAARCFGNRLVPPNPQSP